MPLVVPLLRLAYVFLNVFETFKTLRLPPPSARNGGQPSARAMSQRKRAMKGCMTVWLIWVCFALYERWVETFVWLFIPFYSEIKALFILFFVLTRAKGAEPVFLHVIRPVIKPYTVPLDALFDALSSFGDLLVLVASIPVNFARNYYHRWTSALDPPQADPRTWHRDAPGEARPSTHRVYVSESNGEPRSTFTRDVSTGSARQTRSAMQRSDTSTPTQQIWHPPASVYADEIAFNPHSGLPTPPIERQHRADVSTPTNGSDDWRQYPVFPSAYPPAPLNAPIVAPRPVRAGNAAQFTDIEEDDEDAHVPETRQDFRRSLLLPREPRNPGSDGDSSDEDHMKGVQDIQGTQQIHDKQPDIEMSVGQNEGTQDRDEDESEMDEDEDIYNTTLRTPSKRRRSRDEGDDEDDLDDLMLTPPRLRVAYSIGSVASRSTALSTTDNGSSLRTRTNSVASTDPSSIPDVPPVAAKKRRLSARYVEDDDVKFSVDVPSSKSAMTGKPAASRASSRSRGGTIGRQRGIAFKQTAEDELAEEDVPSDSSSSSKRQRVPQRARPVPQRGNSQGTIRAPSTRTRSVASTRSTVTRPPPTRVAGRKQRPPVPAKKPSTGSSSVASERRQTTGAPVKTTTGAPVKTTQKTQ